MNIYPGMYDLRARNEKFKPSLYTKRTPSQEEIEGCPIGPAYLLMIQEQVTINDGYSESEGGGSYIKNYWKQLWTYDLQAWTNAIIKIENENRDPNRNGKSKVYLAYKVNGIPEVTVSISLT